MKVYLVEYRYWDDAEVVGIFTSAAVAEKYIERSILTCFGKKADISKYRSLYHVSIEDVVGE